MSSCRWWETKAFLSCGPHDLIVWNASIKNAEITTKREDQFFVVLQCNWCCRAKEDEDWFSADAVMISKFIKLSRGYKWKTALDLLAVVISFSLCLPIAKIVQQGPMVVRSTLTDDRLTGNLSVKKNRFDGEEGCSGNWDWEGKYSELILCIMDKCL